MAIYDEKIKEEVLMEKRSKNNIPDYVCVLLYIIKLLHYKWKILPFDVFYQLKKICLNYLVEGKDYIICPITKLRKTSIRSNYTENILGMTMEQYLEKVGKDFVLIARN
jgi:hypothetical protein